jgi:long-chain acyl-CoA synthetase
MSQSLFTVSLYDTLGPTAIEYIANHAKLACIVTSLPHIPTLLKLKGELPLLKIIICLDPLTGTEAPGYTKLDILTSLGKDAGVTIMAIDQVEELGLSLGPIRYNPPAPTDIITINYTSGTTGPPKGVLLTHRAAVGAASSGLSLVPLSNKDVCCSYLPLAHIYARMTEHCALWAGAAIGYFHGNILELVDDFKLLRPTALNSVPRLYNRFGGAIREATVKAPGFRGALSRHIVNTKLAKLEKPESKDATNKHAFYDRIWGRKVAGALGFDRTHTMVTGSAPIDPSLQQFLRVVFGNTFYQGYGLTETYAVGLGQLPGDYTTGNCGAVAPSDECCLLSVPDMEYFVTDKPHPRGELLMRGTSLFSGYYRNDEETNKSMTSDGWFKTGDICSVDEKGRFKIIDRRKNVLKLAQGEYISPERIENVYTSHLTYLGTAYVHGDSVQTFLVAIFGVQPDTFAPFASKVLGREILPTDMQAIAAAAADVKVRKAVCKDLDAVGRKNKFAGYERVRNCYLMLDPFSIENELLTPT